MLSKILFPTDFSDASQHAMGYIKQLKGSGVRQVVVLHVTDAATFDKIEPFVLSQRFQRIRANVEQEARRALAGVAAELKAGGFDVKVLLRSGSPVQEIVRVEDEEAVSEVVMGSHTASGFERLVSGSTAEAVAHRSTRPVLIVRH